MKPHSRLDYVLIAIAGLSAGMITTIVVIGLMKPEPVLPPPGSGQAPVVTPTPTSISTPTPMPTPDVTPVPPPPPIDPLVEIRSLIAKGSVSEAKERLKTELDRNPSAIAMSLLALAHIRDNELVDAKSALSRTAMLDANLPELPFYEGHYEMVRGNFEGARRSYDEALVRRPGDVEMLAARSTARYHLGEFAGAIEDATLAIMADPKHAEAVFTRAIANERMDRPNESLRDYNTFVSLRPADVTGYLNRAKVHLALQQGALAVEDWKKAIEIKPALEGELRPLIDQFGK